MNRIRPALTGLTLAAAAAVMPLSAWAADVSARLESDSISTRDSTTLVVTSDEGTAPNVQAPPGVSLQSIGQQSRTVIQNGSVESSVSHLYRVAAAKPGTYRLDKIRVGDSLAPPVTLQVSASAGGASPSVATPAAKAATSSAAARAFMTLSADKRQLYVGESVPITVRAYFRAGTGVTVTGPPQLTSDAFTLTGLTEEPQQGRTEIRGEPHVVVAWRGTLTAAKSGEFPLSARLPLTLKYEVDDPTAQTSGRSLRNLLDALPFGGGFDDPFFDSMLDEPLLQTPGRVVSQELTLQTKATESAVLPLPSEGKPADFTGAVGKFEVTSNAPEALVAGEPVDLRMTITGTGNFDRVSSRGLADTGSWKTYAPTSRFEPSNTSPLGGKRTFVQPVVAREAGPQEIPPLAFSYFDPDTAQYVTKTTDPIRVQVAAATLPLPPPAREKAPDGARPPANPTSVSTLRHGGVPGWTWPLGLGVLLFAGVLTGAARLRRSSAAAAAMAQARDRYVVVRHRIAMRAAARRGDVAAFLRAARCAIQQRLGTAWGLRPDTITATDVTERWPSAPADVLRVLELADELEYGVRRESLPQPEKLPLWSRTLEREIAAIKVLS